MAYTIKNLLKNVTFSVLMLNTVLNVISPIEAAGR
jgi:hypothetical protein